MVNILTVKGSPRKDSNSFLLLQRALEGIKNNLSLKRYNIENIDVSELEISCCQACDYCYQNRECCIRDDMSGLYEIFDSADIILVSTPVFFGGVPAQFKKLIDRCQVIWASKYKLRDSLIDRNKNRMGYVFAAAGAPEEREQFLAVKKEVTMFFRVLNTDYRGDFFVSDVERRPVSDRDNVLNKANNIGKKIAREFIGNDECDY